MGYAVPSGSQPKLCVVSGTWAIAFCGKQVRNGIRIDTGDVSLRQTRNRDSIVAVVPFDPCIPKENPWGRIVQSGFKISIRIVLARNIHVVFGTVVHEVGEEAPRDFE